MFQIVRLMDEQQSINKKIANQIPVIVQKSVQEQSKKPKRKGFLGIFGKKKEVTPAVSTTILHSVNRNVISEQKVQDRQLSEQADHRIFIRHALEGCRDFYRPGYGYKKAGVVITRLVQEEGFAHSLFSDMAALEKESRLSESIDSIHKAFGRGAVLLGSQGSGEIKMSREHQSPHYTTLWSDIPKTSVR